VARGDVTARQEETTAYLPGATVDSVSVALSTPTTPMTDGMTSSSYNAERSPQSNG
jgi:hypothetical protein